MARKYIDDLGIKLEHLPEGWCQDDERQTFWEEQREEYGFDERETWSLDYSLKLWLYERLMMFNEANIIDTSIHKFKYKDEEITLQDCIDRMIEGLKLDLTLDEFSEEREEHRNKIDDVFPLLALCHWYLWW